MIEEVIFIKKYRCFNNSKKFKFQPGVNLLVGDQGCGKSSLLDVIKDIPYHRNVAEIIASRSKFKFFDFEKMNPRLQDPNTSKDIKSTFASRFVSHGEMTNKLLNISFDDVDVILLDEPDMALSIRSIIKLINLFSDLVNDGKQIIASVHNPLLIQSQQKVLCLENNKGWITSKTFIKLHMSEI